MLSNGMEMIGISIQSQIDQPCRQSCRTLFWSLLLLIFFNETGGKVVLDELAQSVVESSLWNVAN